MLDVLTVIGVLSTAHKTLSSMFQAGRDIEQCAQDLHRWISASQDLDQHEKELKRPNAFNKVFKAQAIEKQVLQVYAAKKRVEKQRLELKNHIISVHGMKGWDDLRALEAKIRKQRTEAIYAQRELRRRIMEFVVGSIMVAIICTMVIGIAYVATAGS